MDQDIVLRIGLDNVFGRLKPDVVKRLQAIIANPTLETWDDAFSIIIRGHDMTTLWQAVIAVDPTFPRSGKVTDARGKVVKNWPKVPTRETLIKALLYAARTGRQQ